MPLVPVDDGDDSSRIVSVVENTLREIPRCEDLPQQLGSGDRVRRW
jgi:hypothetical protein